MQAIDAVKSNGNGMKIREGDERASAGEAAEGGVPMSLSVLIADGDVSLMERCASLVRSEGHSCETESDADALVRRLERKAHDVVLLGEDMPGVEPMELLPMLRTERPRCLTILLTGDPSTEGSVAALRAGAWDYLAKPFSAPHLLTRLAAATYTLEQTRVLAAGPGSDGVLLKNGLTILGVSDAIRKAVEKAVRVARTDASVLLTGESGTGKELFARLIHEKSQRASRTFVPVNCAALPSELLESEMFGHRRGAFTGAVREKPGLLETAHRGTLFLDEVADMPMELQAKLLRVIQDGAVRRVGSEEIDTEVDVRFVSATNRDSEEAVADGELRQDLFYRLRVVPIELPPLRERREDIPVMVRHFLARWWTRYRGSEGPAPRLSPEAMDVLFRHPWPGNVRELENLMEQVVIFARPGSEIRPDELPIYEGGGEDEEGDDRASFAPDQMVDFGRSYHDAKENLIARFEREYLSRVVTRAEGNLTEAARQSGVDRTTLYRLMDKHGLSRENLTA